MHAELVWDGLGVRVPGPMGTPSPGQMQGGQLERLSELAARVCYDSLGNGRTSPKLHEHILEVRHLSVYRHGTITVSFDWAEVGEIALACLNKKGVWVEYGVNGVEITANLQSIIEWDRYRSPFDDMHDRVGDVLKFWANDQAPMIVQSPDSDVDGLMETRLKATTELSDDQAHIAIYMLGSRGFSHEQVRHNYAVSQRSTRYVDEDGSPYVEHPLTTAYLASGDPGVNLCRALINESVAADRRTYKTLVAYFQDYLLGKGVDKLSARKQARGAARGYLGNALQTELIFTSSVNGWKNMLGQRKNPAADGEIRQVYTPVLEALQESAFGDRFADYQLTPSTDGIGTVIFF